MRQAFFTGDEHGNLRAVLRFVEDLLEFVLGGIEWDLGVSEEFAFAGHRVDAVDGWRLDIGLEAEEAVAIDSAGQLLQKPSRCRS